MNGTKSILASRTAWGAVITLASLLGAAFGVEVAPAEQAQLVESVSVVGGLVGTVMAIWGRARASKRIG